jgi:NADP-dependent 3-hydroxy acid dehydrogenase YdfG
VASLSRRVAVVTGASSGIGQAIALALAEAGAELLLVGRDAARLRATAEAARRVALSASPTIVEFAADLTEDRSIDDLARRAMSLGGTAILVHSAGIYERAPLAAATVESLDRQYRANLRAPYLLTQALLPQLTDRQGDIVFINSTQGLAAAAGVGQFAATQHAMKAVADSLRAEINAVGVRVLTLHAGRTATPRQQKIFADEARRYEPERLMQPADVAALVLAVLALPRTAEVTTLTMRPMQK